MIVDMSIPQRCEAVEGVAGLFLFFSRTDRDCLSCSSITEYGTFQAFFMINIIILIDTIVKCQFSLPRTYQDSCGRNILMATDLVVLFNTKRNSRGKVQKKTE